MPHLSPHRPRDPSLLLPFPLPLPSPSLPPNPSRLSYFTVKIVECSSTVRERERDRERERASASRWFAAVRAVSREENGRSTPMDSNRRFVVAPLESFLGKNF